MRHDFTRNCSWLSMSWRLILYVISHRIHCSVLICLVMPVSAPQMLDQLHGMLSRINSQMVAADVTEDDTVARDRYRLAQQDIEKTMPLVKRIKGKVSSERQIKTGGVATGTYAKATVLAGRKEKTASNLTKDHLKKNRKGKVVTKAASAAGEAKFKHIQPWVNAVRAARLQLGVAGFGKLQGKLLKTARRIYAETKA